MHGLGMLRGAGLAGLPRAAAKAAGGAAAGTLEAGAKGTKAPPSGLWGGLLEEAKRRIPDPQGLAVAAGRILDGFLILLCCWVAVLVIRKGTEWALRAVQRRARLKRRFPLLVRQARTVQAVLESVGKYVIYFLGIVAVLWRFGIDPMPVLAGAGIVGLAVGFGCQGLVQDLVTGFFLIFEGQLAVGDYVELAGKRGIVEDLTLRVVKVRDAAGALHTIPNRSVGLVTNFTAGALRAHIDVAVDGEEDAVRAAEVLAGSAAALLEELAPFLAHMAVEGTVRPEGGRPFVRLDARVQPTQEGLVAGEIAPRLRADLEAAGIAVPGGKVRVLWSGEPRTSGP